MGFVGSSVGGTGVGVILGSDGFTGVGVTVGVGVGVSVGSDGFSGAGVGEGVMVGSTVGEVSGDILGEALGVTVGCGVNVDKYLFETEFANIADNSTKLSPNETIILFSIFPPWY